VQEVDSAPSSEYAPIDASASTKIHPRPAANGHSSTNGHYGQQSNPYAPRAADFLSYVVTHSDLEHRKGIQVVGI